MARRHRRVVWTNQAQLALNEALDYIAQDSVVADAEIRILAFIHGAQDFARWQYSE